MTLRRARSPSGAWGPNAGGDLAYLTCGTGFGVGLMLDGKVRYAPDGRTPEYRARAL